MKKILLFIFLIAPALYAQTPTPNPYIAPSTSSTMVVTPGIGIVTITPTGSARFDTTSVGNIGQFCTFIITTSGTSSYTMTFGTNFIANGTLETGTESGKRFTVTFRCTNGTTWIEIGRTGAM